MTTRRSKSRDSPSRVELECRLDILKSYIDQAMKLQSDVDNLDSDNDDRAELENLCVTP